MYTGACFFCLAQRLEDSRFRILAAVGLAGCGARHLGRPQGSDRRPAPPPPCRRAQVLRARAELVTRGLRECEDDEGWRLVQDDPNGLRLLYRCDWAPRWAELVGAGWAGLGWESPSPSLRQCVRAGSCEFEGMAWGLPGGVRSGL
jgi:hypothetical protein